MDNKTLYTIIVHSENIAGILKPDYSCVYPSAD